MSEGIVFFKKLSLDAKMPEKLSATGAAYDFFSTENYSLAVGERHLFKTNIACHIPVGMYGRIAPRSGLAYKHGIDVLAGVIDADYRWDIGILLVNLGSEFVEIEKGERIAQFILEKCFDVERKEADDLEATERSMGAYGSTGRF